MYYGEEAIIETAVKENKEVIIELPISLESVKEISNKLLESGNFNDTEQSIIKESITGVVSYDSNVKVMFSDTFSMTRAQQQKSDNERVSEHGTRVKIREPKEFTNLCIMIPRDNKEPVYLAKGKTKYNGKTSSSLDKAVDNVEKDRKYYNIIFDHPNDTKEQVRALTQMISKNSSITNVTSSADNEYGKKIEKAFEKRDNKEKTNGT